jgi:hypothetical protein
MNYNSFFGKDSVSKKNALDLAFSDIKDAFMYYMQHENQGRPIIIAGHSQGTVHAIRLLKYYFDDKPFKSQLIAAYLPGWTVYRGFYENIPVCEDSTQTGCIMSWCTYELGYEPDNPEWFANAVVVNPVSWCTCDEVVPADFHKGTVLKNYNSCCPKMVTTMTNDGYLWVTKPEVLCSEPIITILQITIFSGQM